MPAGGKRRAIAASVFLGVGTLATAQEPPLDIIRDLTLPVITAPFQTFRAGPGATPKSAGDRVPVPRLRPGELTAAAAVAATITTTAQPGEVSAYTVPLPRLRGSKPRARAASVNTTAASGVGGACVQKLARQGVALVAMPPITDKGGCGIPAPVAVAAVGSTVTLTERAQLTCDTAEALNAWVKGTVQPAALTHLGGRVTGLRVAASYACRSRNSESGAKLSEHAVGRAIDISAVEVSGKGWLTVGAETGGGQKFLAAIRREACGPFTTVLGPGSDAHHEDHLHLDNARRRNGSNYCK